MFLNTPFKVFVISVIKSSNGQILFYRWLNPLTSASQYLLDITDKSSFDKAMSYIKELTEANPVSLFEHSRSTTPTTTAIFQFLQVV